MRLRTAVLAFVAATLVGAAGAHAAAAYENPFTGEQPSISRTDMGVDVCLTPGQPIRAIGNGVVTGIERNWYAGQPYIWYELADGPDAGRYVYIAEQIDHLARVGQTLSAGDVVARYAKKGTCIEIGWSTAGGETLAAATSGYAEGEVTAAGVSFAHLLISAGVPGQFELVAARAARVKRRHRRHRVSAVTVRPKLAPKPAPTPGAPAPARGVPVAAPVPAPAQAPAPAVGAPAIPVPVA